MPSDGRFQQPLRTITITNPTQQETLLGVPESLPLTEPGTSQIIYTLQASDFPVISGGVTCKYTAFVVAAGKNTNAGNQTVTYRVLKNGSSIATATTTNITTNYYWTSTHYRFYDVAVGDTLECRLWASSTDVNWDYKALFIYPLNHRLCPDNGLITNAEYTVGGWPALALGNPYPGISQGFTVYSGDINVGSIQTKTKYKAQVIGPIYGGSRGIYGDVNMGSSWYIHASYRPNYARMNNATLITFNPSQLTVS